MRRRWVRWAIGGALALLLLIAGGIWLRSSQPHGKPLKLTGDALLDLYLADVQHYIDYPTERTGALLWYQAVEDDLKECESEFKDDPHYWQLRFANSNALRETASFPGAVRAPQAPGFDEDPRVPELMKYLPKTRWLLNRFREAQARPFKDPDLLMCIYWDIGEPLAPDFRDTLLAEICQAGPDRAWPHYTLGIALLKEHRYDEAEHELHLGNAAPNKCFPRLFPLAEAEQSIRNGRPVGNEEVTWWLSVSGVPGPFLGVLLPVCVTAENELQPALYPQHKGLFAEAHWFACHIGADNPGPSALFIAATAIVRTVADRVTCAQTAGLSEEQLRVVRAVSQVSMQLQSFGTEEMDAAHRHLTALNRVGSIGRVPGLQPLANEATNRLVFRDNRREMLFIERSYPPVFKVLLSVDYRTLAVPQELSDYMNTFAPQPQR